MISFRVLRTGISWNDKLIVSGSKYALILIEYTCSLLLVCNDFFAVLSKKDGCRISR